MGRLLRQKRKEFRLTLRQVSDRLAERGDRIPASTLARIEQGKLDPGVRRLHLLLRLYDVPPHLVADLVELETLAVEAPPTGDLDTLHREGIAHWKRGDIDRGLAYLFAVRQHVPRTPESRRLRQSATLTFATFARNLGKFKLARQVVDDVLCEPPDPSLRLRALVLAASLWRGLGSLDVALALVQRAAGGLEPGDDEQAAWVLHEEAKLLLCGGEADRAERSLDRALEHYRRIGDGYGEAKALLLRIQVLEARGRLDDALECARTVIERSERLDQPRLAAVARLSLGRLLVRAGSAAEGLQALERGLGQAVLFKDRNAEFHAHYELWHAYRALGDAERARFELQAARYFVRFIDESSPEADEVRAQAADAARGDAGGGDDDAPA